MVKVKNHLGTIKVSSKYLRKLISTTIESCFGVSGMNHYGAIQGVNNLFKKNIENNGVIIKQKNDSIVIDLHITVTYGINVNAITESIIHKVEYVLSEKAGITVESINIYVDGLVN